ncbi:MAG: DUF4838 domain-containing protein, partial [Lachnospiraceae bacterium]|nr:DUF4838 domain-containing protein [Lachnospiraceae bacterium]
MKIHLLSNDQTSQFAADELEAYLIRMGCPDLTYCLSVSDSVMSASPAACETYADHTEDNPASSIKEKPAETLRQDQTDSYSIHVSADSGRISGSNPRALLLGVYRYLTLIGCRFLRPGREWEIVPVLTAPEQFYASETCAAGLRHRGVCLEGADSIENILDFIDWSPKIGFNSFFLQFKYPHTFLKRWYSHENNPDLVPQSWTMEDSMHVMPYLSKAMEKRGLLQHRVGHGWTGEVLGCKATGWETETLPHNTHDSEDSTSSSENSIADPKNSTADLEYSTAGSWGSTTDPQDSTAGSWGSTTDSKDSNTDSMDSTAEIQFSKNRFETEQPSAAELRSLIAEVNGKRDLFQGIPTNTNLCLSNPTAVEHLADRVALYLQENPQTDYLHIWMADACNNFCECENCRKLRPSDHYIALLNRIDERLCEQNIPTRIVLLLYMDLLWSPLKARLHHPERFVLMFAPITRTFEESYADYAPQLHPDAGPLSQWTVGISAERNDGNAEHFSQRIERSAADAELRALPHTPVPEFRLLHLSFPSDLETYLAFLREWQEK